VWRGVRKKEEGKYMLFGFPTMAANDMVRPIHAKAMPVILATERERETWLTAPPEEALLLERPAPEGLLRIVATGEKEDNIVA
jgi:putative SOS response-associated peptidase YedK